MTTSGTLATTVIDNSAVLEHSLRRCGILPSAQTPEMVMIAKQNLYMLLVGLTNRGLNLWCVDKTFMGVTNGQPAYETPAGTIDVLNVIYCQPTIVTSVFASTVQGGTATLATASNIIRVGFVLASNFTGVISVAGILQPSTTYLIRQAYWVDLPINSQATVFVVESSTTPLMPINIFLVSKSYDLPLTPWNRDTYLAINDKNKVGRPSTNYFYEKKIDPRLTIWPVPNNNTDHLLIYRHRQVMDIGSLTDQLEIPDRWLDGIIWLLSARVCFEIPGVPPDRIQICVQMADKQVLEAEASETDGAPMYITPGIACYTK